MAVVRIHVPDEPDEVPEVTGHLIAQESRRREDGDPPVVLMEQCRRVIRHMNAAAGVPGRGADPERSLAAALDDQAAGFQFRLGIEDRLVHAPLPALSPMGTMAS